MILAQRQLQELQRKDASDLDELTSLTSENTKLMRKSAKLEADNVELENKIGVADTEFVDLPRRVDVNAGLTRNVDSGCFGLLCANSKGPPLAACACRYEGKGSGSVSVLTPYCHIHRYNRVL